MPTRILFLLLLGLANPLIEGSLKRSERPIGRFTVHGEPFTVVLETTRILAVGPFDPDWQTREADGS